MSELVLESKSELPKGWIYSTLENLSFFITKGTTPTTHGFSFQKKGINFIKAENIVNGWIENTIISEFISKDAYDFLKRSQLKENDVLFSIAGTIGRTTIIRKTDLPANTNQALAIIRCPWTFIEPKFVRLILDSPNLFNLFNEKKRGMGLDNVSLGDLKSLLIPLPPLNEQKKIVERIEELFSRIDSISKIFDKKKSLLINCQKSILENALNGNLSNSWRKNNLAQLESSETLLNRVQTINDSKIKKSSLSSQKLPNLPQNWVWVKLDDISTKIVDGAHYRPTYTTNGIPFLSVKDVRNRKVYFDNCKFISNDEHQKLFKRCNPEYGDVLFVKTGATIGRTSVIDTKNEFSLFVSVALVKPKNDFINSKYLSYVLEDHVNHMNINLSLKGVAIKNYHLEDMRLIDFPLTDILEQNEIVRIIEYYLSLIMYLDKQIDQIFEFCNRLKSSILKQAFEGKLVRQDPNDEPAEVLLQKIKHEKEKYEEKIKMEKQQLIQKQKASRRSKNVK